MNPKCGQCEEVEAILKCLQCDEVFCQGCTDRIHAKGKLKTHLTMPLAELADLNSSLVSPQDTQQNSETLGAKLPAASKRSYRYSINVNERCPAHFDERLCHFCLVDHKVVCAQCLLLGEHKGHAFEKLSVAFPRLKQQLVDLESDVEKQKATSQTSLENLRFLQQKLRDNSNVSLDNIQNGFQSIYELLKEKQEAITLSVDAHFRDSIAAIETKILSIQSSIDKLDGLQTSINSSKGLSDPIQDTHKILELIQCAQNPEIPTTTTGHIDSDVLFRLSFSGVISSIRKMEARKNSDSLIKKGLTMIASGFSPRVSVVQSPAVSSLRGSVQSEKPHSHASVKLFDEFEAVDDLNISLPLEGTFRHDAHMGLNQDTGALEYHGIPDEWTAMLKRANKTLLEEGKSEMSQIEAETVVKELSGNLEDDLDLDIFTKAEAIHDFSSDVDGEIHFKAGDIVYVIQEHESGWWYGLSGGAEGFFPGNHVEKMGKENQHPKSLKKRRTYQSLSVHIPSVASPSKSATAPPTPKSPHPPTPSRSRPSSPPPRDSPVFASSILESPIRSGPSTPTVLAAPEPMESGFKRLLTEEIKKEKEARTIIYREKRKTMMPVSSQEILTIIGNLRKSVTIDIAPISETAADSCE